MCSASVHRSITFPGKEVKQPVAPLILLLSFPSMFPGASLDGSQTCKMFSLCPLLLLAPVGALVFPISHLCVQAMFLCNTSVACCCFSFLFTLLFHSSWSKSSLLSQTDLSPELSVIFYNWTMYSQAFRAFSLKISCLPRHYSSFSLFLSGHPLHKPKIAEAHLAVILASL